MLRVSADGDVLSCCSVSVCASALCGESQENRLLDYFADQQQRKFSSLVTINNLGKEHQSE
jgi:hypothetical protein